MPPRKKTIEERVLDQAVKYWVRFHGATDSLKIASALKLDNEDVKQAMLNLEAAGLVTLNKDATLNPMKFGKNGIEFFPPVQCHVIFPTSEVLTDHFYKSDLKRRNFPVYVERVLMGRHPYSFVFFQEEALRKYITRPDLYDVTDTISGGHITYTGEDEPLFMHVRHGRRKLDNGRSALAVYLVDLKRMSESEQRYWYGFEIKNPVFSTAKDEGFSDFLDVSLGGRWIAYKDPVSDAVAAIRQVNERLGVPFFRNVENILLHAPVENTEKAYCDACGELHKLIGNDSLNKPVLESLLLDNFGATRAEFTHKETKRPLSGLQLMQLIEDKAGAGKEASKVIKSIGDDRGKAAHALTFKGTSDEVYVESFHAQCITLMSALENFSEKVAEALRKTSIDGNRPNV